MTSPDAPNDILDWDEQDQPRSLIYGDLYYSRDDGLAETRAVFLDGCGLPGGWDGRRHFCVAELGFGVGLNAAALIDLWRRSGPADGRLHVFSVEAHPVAAPDAAKALGHWPELAPIAEALVAQWPGRAKGFHRIHLPQWRVTLDIAVMEALEALNRWTGRADAWFLDGFAPALNPAMWRSEVLQQAATRSAPGARLATYTVAVAVRRGLAEAGFTVERHPGFGRKRERLEARRPGQAAAPAKPPRIAVIGAGIAGASLARAFRLAGGEAQVFDAVGVGAGASGGPAVLAAPRLDAGLGPAAALFAQAMRCCGPAYAETPGAVIAEGAIQLEAGPKDPRRFAAIAGSDLFEAGAMTLLDAAAAAARLGEAVPPGLGIGGAVAVDPRALLPAWLPSVSRGEIARLQADGARWRLMGADGETIAEADVVCVAAGMATTDLVPGLTMTPVRGQASWSDGLAPAGPALFGGYVIPTREGLLFGSTHDRDDTTTDVREEDQVRNLTALAAVLPDLAARLAGRPLKAYTGVRATTRDYLPLAGAASPDASGLFILTGLGSRGYCLGPLLAEHVAALALGVPSPLPAPLADLVDPARFARRLARKGRPRAD